MFDVAGRVGPARNRMDGKIAIVTGAGSQGKSGVAGTGKAIAVCLAREGAKLCLVDQAPERSAETLEMIKAEGGEAISIAGDVTSAADCQRIVEETLKSYGRVTTLVNNVGIVSAIGRLENVEEAVWEKVVDVNLKSVFLMAKYAVPHMVAAGSGSIVNISSTGGMRASGGSAYGPSKAAMISLTRELAVIYGRDHIRSNVICPGMIHTAFVAEMNSPQVRAARRKASPLGIEGDAWDIAMAALFLASDDARFVNGVCLPVDGGVSETSAMVTHRFISEAD